MRVHEDFAVARLLLPLKGPFEPREGVCGSIGQDMGDGSRCLVAPGLVNMAAQGGNLSASAVVARVMPSASSINRSTTSLPRLRELVLHRASPWARSPRNSSSPSRTRATTASKSASFPGSEHRSSACFRRHLRDLIETSALISPLRNTRWAASRIRAFTSPARSLQQPSRTRPFQIVVLAHHQPHPCIHDAASVEAR